MRRPLALLFGISFLTLALTAPSSARAERTREEEAATSTRALNGHVFLPSSFLVPPFSTTHVGSIASYAYATATGNRYDLQGNVVGTRDYTLAGLGNNIAYQQRLADWMAVRVGANAIVYSGVNAVSALGAGATVRANLGLGLTAGLPLAHAVRLAFVFDANFQPAFDLTVAAGLRRAIITRSFDSSNVFATGRTFNLQPGVSVAWAPHRAVGLEGAMRYVYTNVQKSDTQNAVSDALDMAAFADVDFATISAVEIGLGILYRLQKPVGNGDGFRVQDFGGGIYYTGRPHLTTGLAVTYQWFHVSPDISATAWIIELPVRYYW